MSIVETIHDRSWIFLIVFLVWVGVDATFGAFRRLNQASAKPVRLVLGKKVERFQHIDPATLEVKLAAVGRRYQFSIAALSRMIGEALLFSLALTSAFVVFDVFENWPMWLRYVLAFVLLIAANFATDWLQRRFVFRELARLGVHPQHA